MNGEKLSDRGEKEWEREKRNGKGGMGKERDEWEMRNGEEEKKEWKKEKKGIGIVAKRKKKEIWGKGMGRRMRKRKWETLSGFISTTTGGLGWFQSSASRLPNSLDYSLKQDVTTSTVLLIL